jgi:hypothetical protein
MKMDSKGKKIFPKKIDISENQWIEMMQHVRNGIFRKLDAVRKIQLIDKDIAAGIYVYAVEEFGKLLLLREAPSHNGKRRVKYAEEFVIHKVKTKKASDYFRSNNFHVCMILAQGCPGQTSDVEEANWDNVIVDLAADTKARLSIFYSDFVYDSNNNPVVESPPDVEPEMLQKASEQLEFATKRLPPIE